MASGDSAGSPGKVKRQPAKQKAAAKAKAGAKKAEQAPPEKAQKAGAGKAKAGRKSKHAPTERTTGRAKGDEEGAEGVSRGQKGSRKGKAATSARHKQKPATAKPASWSDKADEEEQSAAFSGLLSSPLSATKARPAKRGRKALSDNAAEQHDDNGDDTEAAAHSPKGNKITAAKGAGKAGLKAASKGKKGASQGQQKEAKARQPSTRQQPR